MAPESQLITTKVTSGSPYQLDRKQTIKASGALLKHIISSTSQAQTQNLLAADPTSSDISVSDATPIWLILTTKKFMTDQSRLKPRKIALPHSLNTSSNTSICLITTEPQRLYKDIIAHPSFSTSLSRRITKVISVAKLQKKYHSFETRRQLRDSHDIFLADERIITYLAKALGKTFYKTTQKRPIPVRLQVSEPRAKKNAALPSTKPEKSSAKNTSIVSPPLFAKEIERTISMAQIHLSPSTTTAVRVGLASFTPEQVAANVDAVVSGLTDKLIAWRNIKAIHVKGPNTMALPIWLADELWVNEEMILEDHEVEEQRMKKTEKGKAKRKGIKALPEATNEGPGRGTKRENMNDVESGDNSKRKKAKKLEDEDFGREMKERREKLRQQKKEAREKLEQT